MREVRWERMFPDQLEEAFAQKPVVYYTYGLCEPHGPHNAVGLDALKAHAIAVEAAQLHGGIVAPPDYWHIHELGGYAVWAAENVGEVARKWTTSVPPWVHFKNICYHIRTAEEIGFKAAILFTGHYGPNYEDLRTLVELIQPYVRVRLYGMPEFEANEMGFGDEGVNGDHAGMVETSLLWHLEPDCVDMSRLPGSAGTSAMDQPPFFAMGETAPRSDRRIGETMVRGEVRWLRAKVDALLGEYNESAAVPGLPTFESVEQFWDTEVRPRLPEWQTMQDRWSSADTVPGESVWFTNWKVPDRA